MVVRSRRGYPVRHGQTVAYVRTLDEVAALGERFAAPVIGERACDGGSPQVGSTATEDCINRVAKATLNLVEKAHGQRYSGIGQSLSKVRREKGNKAEKCLKSIHAAFSMV